MVGGFDRDASPSGCVSRALVTSGNNVAPSTLNAQTDTGGSKMGSPYRRNIVRALIAGAGGLALGACVAVEHDVVTVPPPALRAEVVPVLPPERAALEYWQPGYW